MKTGLFFLFCTFLLLTGCNELVTVNLPSNFHGGVFISCGSGDKLASEVDIDSKGLGTLDACPKKPVRIVIMREGEQIKPSAEHPPMWNQTAEGVMAGVDFVVP
jgi:hypothetical protein